MNTRRIKGLLALGALMIIGLTLSGCAGASTVAGASWPGLSFHNDTFYLSNLKVYAFDKEGTPKWSFPATLESGQGFFAPAAADDTLVVVTDYKDAVFGLNPADGTQKWVFKSNRSRFISGAVLGEKLAYAATVDGTVHAIPRDSDGVAKEAWSFATEGAVWGTPLLADGTLYVTSLDRHVYALDAETGKLQWKFPDETSASENPPLGGVVGTPTLHEGILYFGSFNNHLYALDIKTREVIWRFDTTNWVWGSPVVDEETGYVIGADLDGNVFAIDPASKGDAKAVWQIKVKVPVVGSPVLRKMEDGTTVVYMTTSGNPNLFVLNAKDGSNALPAQSITFDFPTMFLFFQTGTDTRPVKIYAAPVFTDGTVVVTTQEGDNALYALDSQTFTSKWKVNLKEADSKLLAAKGQPTQDQGPFGSNWWQTVLLMMAVFMLVQLLLGRRQGGK